MKKKLLSLLLALCMILSACVTLGVTTFATGEATVTDGTLTLDNIDEAIAAGVININGPKDWKVFAEYATTALDSEENTTSSEKTENDVVTVTTVTTTEWIFADFANATVELNADITLSGDDAKWTSIPNFAGTFDGNGHTIKGLTNVRDTANLIKKVVTVTQEGEATPTSSTSNTYKEGGFITILTGDVKNVIFENCTVTVANAQAGMVANRTTGTGVELTGVTVKNCTVTVTGGGNAGGMLGNPNGKVILDDCHTIGGTVKATHTANNGNLRAGGMIGYLTANANTAGSQIKNCTNSATITCLSATGGIIGNARSTDLLIENCTNTGAVNGGATYQTANNFVGGILGQQYTGKTVIRNCTNSGAVTCTDGNNAQTENPSVGGIIGIGDGEVVVQNCVNTATGTVSGSAAAQLGGIAGKMANQSGSISGCKNYAEVKATGAQPNYGGTGGIVGYLGYAATTVSDCLNEGNITGRNAAGIVGVAYRGTDFTNVSNSGSVNSSAYGAGIVAWIRYGGKHNINGAVNTGELTATFRIGGICAYSQDNVPVNFSNILNTADVSLAQPNVGGILGGSEGAVTMKNCMNTGTVTGNGPVGGLIGITTKVATMKNCMNSGAVSVVSTLKSGRAGGLIGSYCVTSGLFENCISTGTVKGGNEYTTGAFLGDIRVKNDDASVYITVKNCYYLENLTSNNSNENNFNIALATYPANGSNPKELWPNYANVRVEYTEKGYSRTYVGGVDNASLTTIKDLLLGYNDIFADGTTGAMVSSADALKGVAGLKLLSKAGYDVVNTWTMAADGTFVPTALAAGEKKTPDADLAISYKGYQMGTVGTDSEGCIRLIAGMNSIDGFAATGFDVVVTENGVDSVPSKPLTTTTVYESLWADGVSGAVKASELGCTYLSALSIENMPADCIITLTATLTPIEGEVVKGTTVVIVVEDGAVVAQYAI